MNLAAVLLMSQMNCFKLHFLGLLLFASLVATYKLGVLIRKIRDQLGVHQALKLFLSVKLLLNFDDFHVL